MLYKLPVFVQNFVFDTLFQQEKKIARKTNMLHMKMQNHGILYLIIGVKTQALINDCRCEKELLKIIINTVVIEPTMTDNFLSKSTMYIVHYIHYSYTKGNIKRKS